MKTIIAGSRTILNYWEVEKSVKDSGFLISEVVCGGANGVDSLGRKWGKNNQIPVKEFLANWNQFGKRAGYLRNEQMAEYADALIAVWDGKSKGTKHMIELAKHKGLEVFVREMDYLDTLFPSETTLPLVI